MRKRQNRLSNLLRGRRLLAAVGSGWLMLPLMVGVEGHVPSQASAQIVPDATLPTNSSVPVGCTVCTIDGGTVKNGNWFHSFSQFSVPIGGEAFFNNVDPAIQNIITRVTGGSISRIDGILRANGTANLFLINPSGIVFGPDAQLNLGGSLIASTANSLRFSDGSAFSAVNPAAAPLLSVSVPLGLQYGANPGRIEVQGPGNFLFVNAPPFQIVRDFRPPGLQVQSGQTLALVGGDVLLSGGNVTAADGRVELGSVAGGTVMLTPTNPGWAFSYSGSQRFGDIRLSQSASVDASGSNGGVIQLQGRNVSVTDGSSLLTLTIGAGSGGRLSINATDSVDVSGSFVHPVFGPLFPSSLLTEVDLGATGSGGTLSINTGRLTVTDGAKVSVSTSGPGSAGNLEIQAQTVELARSSEFFGPSQLAADAANPDSGAAGNITVNADRLTLSGGGWMTALTSGVGSGGAIRVNARSIELTGDATDPVPGLIATQVNPGSSGNGGNIFLAANRLQISGGAQVSTSTAGVGNAGRLQVFASDIEVMGRSTQGPSGLFSAVNPGAAGQGGNLEITAGQLRVADGAQIAADTLGDGNAGNLIVNAQTVELIGATEQGRSGLFAGAIIGSGSGGDLVVNADRLTLRDGATINVSNFPSQDVTIPPGQGSVGNALIKASLLRLENGATITAASNGGDKGNLSFQSDLIVLRQGSSISTNALGTATGGNIVIDTQFLVAPALENSDITANAVGNRGGRVTITAESIFGIAPRAFLTSQSDITASSDLGLAFSGDIEIRTPEESPTQTAVKLPDGLNDNALVTASCEPEKGNSFTITGRGGLPADASQLLRGQSVWPDLRLAGAPTASRLAPLPSVDRQAARPPLESQTPPTEIVEFQGWVVDAKGQVTLVAHTAHARDRSFGSARQPCGAAQSALLP
jgi:filamentous hemagglutinin family protein